MNYVEIFAGKPFLLWFANSLVIALLATAIALPVATAMAYAFARYNTGGAFLRLGVLASQMLPPIILLLPLFGMFLLAGLMQSRTAIVIAHLTFACPSWPSCWWHFSKATYNALEEAPGSTGQHAGRLSA